MSTQVRVTKQGKQIGMSSGPQQPEILESDQEEMRSGPQRTREAGVPGAPETLPRRKGGAAAGILPGLPAGREQVPALWREASRRPGRLSRRRASQHAVKGPERGRSLLSDGSVWGHLGCGETLLGRVREARRAASPESRAQGQSRPQRPGVGGTGGRGPGCEHAHHTHT